MSWSAVIDGEEGEGPAIGGRAGPGTPGSLPELNARALSDAHRDLWRMAFFGLFAQAGILALLMGGIQTIGWFTFLPWLLPLFSVLVAFTGTWILTNQQHARNQFQAREFGLPGSLIPDKTVTFWTNPLPFFFFVSVLWFSVIVTLVAFSGTSIWGWSSFAGLMLVINLARIVVRSREK